MNDKKSVIETLTFEGADGQTRSLSQEIDLDSGNVTAIKFKGHAKDLR